MCQDVSSSKQPLFNRLMGALSSATQQHQGENDEAHKNTGVADIWSLDEELILAKRILNGEHVSAVADMTNNKDLDTIWSNPQTVSTILKAMPMFKGLKGVKEVLAKDEADITPEDVSK